ncbi:hypothetical protein VTK73DRAFT_2948 [Phialemonium thermophilum]|uniref:Uncharacterized protein n=1 Tax=Phialemonium thermophilum TaxID=223376 RepID=A0ABR3VP82_9PEZI
MVLVGRRPDPAPRPRLRPASPDAPRSPQRPVPRPLHQRRGARAHRMGPRQVWGSELGVLQEVFRTASADEGKKDLDFCQLRERKKEREKREKGIRVKMESNAPPPGQLLLARHVGRLPAREQLLRRRPGEPADRPCLRRRRVHLAPRAHAARRQRVAHRGAGPLGLGAQQGGHHRLLRRRRATRGAVRVGLHPGHARRQRRRDRRRRSPGHAAGRHRDPEADRPRRLRARGRRAAYVSPS